MSGGLVCTAATDVEVSCLPQNLPAFIEVEMKEMKAGQTLHASQLAYPKGVTPVLHGSDDPLLVSITHKKTEAADSETPAA